MKTAAYNMAENEPFSAHQQWGKGLGNAYL